jgi:protein involved in sex pheromone biosynthesis
MKRKHILLMGAAVVILSSCGPKLHRYSCGGKRRCISQIEQQKNAAQQKQETPKRNA